MVLPFRNNARQRNCAGVATAAAGGYCLSPKCVCLVDGRRGGWCVICDSIDEKVEDEPFKIGDMLIEMIAETDQTEG